MHQTSTRNSERSIQFRWQNRVAQLGSEGIGMYGHWHGKPRPGTTDMRLRMLTSSRVAPRTLSASTARLHAQPMSPRTTTRGARALPAAGQLRS